MISMNDYLEKGKDVVNVLTTSGYQAYLIGGAVRNTILGIPFDEIDITTNATPDQIKKCFPDKKLEMIAQKVSQEEGLRLYYAGYEFIISTFKTSKDQVKKLKGGRTHYSKVLEDDLASRDFTINAIAMSSGGKLTDAFGGYQDLNKKYIRAIGDAKSRFTDDPIKMIRAIRMVSQLGFKIEKRTLKAMRAKAKYAKKLQVVDLLKEMYKLLNGNYLKQAVIYLYKTRLYRYLSVFGLELKRLSKNYKYYGVDTFLECTFVKGGKIDQDALQITQNEEFITKVFHLATVAPKSKYDEVLLYTYGLEVALEANKVSYLLGKTKLITRKITKKYQALPIKSTCDLLYKGEELLKLLHTNQTEDIQWIIDDLVMKVLLKELPNHEEALKLHVLSLLKQKGIQVNQSINLDMNEKESDELVKQPLSWPTYFSETDLNHEVTLEKHSDTDMLATSKQVAYDYTEHKFDQIERRMNEQEIRIKEKDEIIFDLKKRALRDKMERDSTELSVHAANLMKDLGYVSDDFETVAVKRELKEIYKKVLANINPEFKLLKEEQKHEEN